MPTSILKRALLQVALKDRRRTDDIWEASVISRMQWTNVATYLTLSGAAANRSLSSRLHALPPKRDAIKFCTKCASDQVLARFVTIRLSLLPPLLLLLLLPRRPRRRRRIDPPNSSSSGLLNLLLLLHQLLFGLDILLHLLDSSFNLDVHLRKLEPLGQQLAVPRLQEHDVFLSIVCLFLDEVRYGFALFACGTRCFAGDVAGRVHEAGGVEFIENRRGIVLDEVVSTEEFEMLGSS